MKKIISLALATAMVFTMSAVAFAAGSVEAVTPTVEETTGLTDVVVTPSALAGVELWDGFGATEIASMTSEGMLESGYYSDVAVYGFEIEASEIDAAGGSITLKMDGVSASDIVFVYHFKDLGTGYYETESMTATAGNGSLTISGITSLSPFMVIVATPVVETTTTTTTTTVSSGFPDGFTYDYPYGYWDGDTFVWNGFFNDEGVFVYTTDVAGTTTTTTTSPKTGETNAAAVVACMMLLAGVAVCGLVRKEQL